MASRIAISSPGSTIITSRGGRNCPPAPLALAGPELPGPVRPNPVPAPPADSATRPLLISAVVPSASGRHR